MLRKLCRHEILYLSPEYLKKIDFFSRPHMNSVCSNAGDSSIADEVSEIMNSLSPSELNDIDSEDETNNEIETDDGKKSRIQSSI